MFHDTVVFLFYGVSVCVYRYGVDGCIVKQQIQQTLHHNIALYRFLAIIIIGFLQILFL